MLNSAFRELFCFYYFFLGGGGGGGKPLYPFMACAFKTHDCFVAVFQVVCYCC